ncbi:hypothetical protein PYW07_000375 [Mythimna separata]|uniref:Uncharacterized protein n=1 Tax=Mythimna separata TaxID=271217 RepID=A0AAD7Z335_MYTSE|nr:hypothetical protein PYW07_000375 [Mythimna separata]
MSLKWIVPVLVLCEIMVITSPSIAGVTYMDHFDFEERYRDANECNPLYWHPLHLPPYCAEVFEKLIRSRLAKTAPLRIKRKREKQKYTYPEEIYNFPYPVYEAASAEYETYSQPISPYAEVIELLRRDIEKDPSSPTVTVIPNLGPVALYKQGISRKSEKFIKRMAEEYVKATQKWYKEYYKAHVKMNKYPGPYHMIAQKTENIANAIAETYLAIRKYQKQYEEYTRNAAIAAHEKYFLLIVLSLEGIKCSIDGTFSERRPNATKPGEDPCNPLYWYPKEVPEYCHFRQMSTPPTEPWGELPIPIPVPVPAPLPMLPHPEVPPLMMPPHQMPPGPFPPIPVPHPIMPLPMPLPFGIPLAPTNAMVPVAGIPLPPPPPGFAMPMPPPYPQPYLPPYGSPYPPPVPAPYPSPFPPPYPGPYVPPYPSPYPMPPRNGMGMVPGIPGLVSPDGGINIMPFSDAYSDMLENHKQIMIRRRLRKFLKDYERPPWKSRKSARRQNENTGLHEDNLNENVIF